jgi:hypothetical protein
MRKIAFLAVAALVVAVPAQAQSCAISNSASSTVSCTVGTNFSMTMPSLMSLTLSGTSVTLNAPAAIGEFDNQGLVAKETTGPNFTVRSNRSYRVQVSADAATFSHTAQAGAATYNKPAGDVSWNVASGAFTTLTTTPTDIGSGSSTSSSAPVTVGYRTAFDITKDQPGAYALAVTFTLVAP